MMLLCTKDRKPLALAICVAVKSTTDSTCHAQCEHRITDQSPGPGRARFMPGVTREAASGLPVLSNAPAWVSHFPRAAPASARVAHGMGHRDSDRAPA